MIWRTDRTLMRWVGAGVVGVMPLLAGCDNFFVKETGGTGGGGTTIGGSGANYAYVVNTVTHSLSGFLIGAGTLTPTPNSPYPLTFIPQAAVVTRANTFLYVAGPSALYVFTIGSDGSLANSTQVAAVAIGSELALAVSPDGQWLFGLNSLSSTLDEWKIDSSSGAVTAMTGAAYTLTNATPLPLALRVSPAGDLIFAALGTGGDHVFTLNTTSGAVLSSQQLNLASATTSDNSLMTDSKESTLYVARSGTNGGLAVYTIGSGGSLQAIAGSPFPTGQGTFDVAVDATDKYVYAANRSDGTISGFSVGTGGALTALSGSPYASGKLLTSLVADRSGKYLLGAAAGGSPDLTMYGFDTTVPGKLVTAKTALSGTDPAGSTLVSLAH